MYVHYFSLQLGKRPIRVSGYPYVPTEVGASLDSGDLAHLYLRLHTCLCLWSRFTWSYHHLCMWAPFFPNQEQKSSTYPRSDFWRQHPGLYPRKYRSIWGKPLLGGGGGGCTPFFNAFLQTAFITTTKRHVGNVSPLKVHSLLSSEQVLAALSNRYHLDIFNSLCCPQSHLQTVNWRSGVSKTWNLRLPGGISLFPSNFSK